MKQIQIHEVDYQKLVKELGNLIDQKFSELENNGSKKLSISEVAEELGVTKITVHSYIKKGLLRAIKIGRRVYVKRDDLNSALKEYKSLKYKR